MIPISKREREVLREVARGLADKAIGPRLGIASGTVHSHVKSAMKKLGASSRAAAVYQVFAK